MKKIKNETCFVQQNALETDVLPSFKPEIERNVKFGEM